MIKVNCKKIICKKLMWIKLIFFIYRFACNKYGTKKQRKRSIFTSICVCVCVCGQSALFGIFPKTRSSSLHAILWVVGLGRCSLNERFSSLENEILVATFDKPNGHRIRAPFYMGPRLSLGLMFKVINNNRIIKFPHHWWKWINFLK